MTLGRCEKEKKKRRSSTDNYLMRDADEVTKSLFHSTRVYVTGPGGSGKKKERRRRYTSSQASQTRFGKGESEVALSCELLFPSLSFSVAFSSACNSSRPISPHSVSEVPTLAGKGWDRSPEAVRATAAVAKTCFKKNRSRFRSGSDTRDVPHQIGRAHV